MVRKEEKMDFSGAHIFSSRPTKILFLHFGELLPSRRENRGGEGFLRKYVTAPLTHCVLTLLLFFFFFFLLMCFLNQISSGFFFLFCQHDFKSNCGFWFYFLEKINKWWLSPLIQIYMYVCMCVYIYIYKMKKLFLCDKEHENKFMRCATSTTFL